jgi:TM2 domain-containing membrane protein YozV/ribosomal protein L40E
MSDVQKAGLDEKYCSSCGAVIKKEAVVCPKCGVSQQKLEQEVVNGINAAKKINPKWVGLLWLTIALGLFGVHRFFVGKIGTGIIWFFTLGISGLGWIIDIVTVASGKFKDKQGNVITIKR